MTDIVRSIFDCPILDCPRPEPRDRVAAFQAAIDDWLDVKTLLQESDGTVTIVAVLPCLHQHRITISYELLLTRWRGHDRQLDLIDRLVEETPRSCFCVPRREVSTR